MKNPTMGQASTCSKSTAGDQTRLDAAYLNLVKNRQIYEGSVDSSVPIILEQCARDLGVGLVGLWIASDHNRTLSCQSLYVASSDRFETGTTVTADAFPRYFNALRSSRTLDAVDAPNDPRTKAFVGSAITQWDVRSLLDTTIRDTRAEGQMSGVLCVAAVGKQREWSTEERMYATSVADLLSQRLVADELVDSEARYRALFDSTNQGVILFDGVHFGDVNQAACAMFGATKAEMRYLTPIDLSPTFQPNGRRSLEMMKMHGAAAIAGGPQHYEWRHARRDGVEFDAEVTLSPITIGGVETVFALMRDITDKNEAQQQARLAQQELEYRATHDSLTGLLNLQQLHIHVDQLIAAVQEPTHRIALLLFDLNRFKDVNDTLGHASGDRVLVQVASLLKKQADELGGTLFRFGGDEFVGVFQNTMSDESRESVVAIFDECLDTTIAVDGVSFKVGASMGGAIFPGDGNNSHELLRRADVAMYHRKSHEEVSAWYDPANDLNNKRRLSMAADLGNAIQQDQLVLHFQPRIHLQSGQIAGCEALVRWQHPELGLVPPGDFLPLAEMSTLIHPLTEWVVSSAFSQIKQLRSLGHDIPVAVNLSPRTLLDTKLFDLIEELLAIDNIDSRLFEIEITESALIKNPKRALQNLHRLEALGVSIAIDDFGTGYSSLGLLKELPVDTLKIDRSFVNDLLSSASDEAIVSSTISLAHNFSATVVAEGVEDQETLDVLKEMNCDEAQGFFIAKPMPAQLFEQWLSSELAVGADSSRGSDAA